MRIPIALAAFLVACTTSSGYRVPVEDPGLQPAASVSEVFVSIDENAVAEDRLAVFRAHGGIGRVRDAVVDHLMKSSLIDSTSPATLHVEVVAFRLRSTSTSVWVGSMAGDDNLSVEGTVKTDGRASRKFGASASSLRGGLFFPGSGGRFDNLANHVADELVGEMLSAE